MFVLLDAYIHLPLAMNVVHTQESEGCCFLFLLEQARRHLGNQGRSETIVIDRGYLDRASIWQVHQQGVIFVVTSKAGLVVMADAQARARVREQEAHMAPAKEPVRSDNEQVDIEA